jgi:hypothetical protein
MALAWLPNNRFRRGILVLLVVAASLLCGYLAVLPSAIRPLLAVSAMLSLVGLVWKQPRAAIGVLFAALPFLGLARRLLIPVAGWSGTDPILMVTPVAAVSLLAFWVVGRSNPAFSSPMTKGITFFMAIATVQMANPLQGSPLVGLGGGLVMIPPLFWFYTGSGLLDRRLVQALLSTMKVIAVLVAVYGLYQTFFGLLPVEELWVSLAGYNSLYVGSTLRAISTFASGTEYVMYVGLAAVICIMQAMSTRKYGYLAPLAIYLPAMFLVSSRGPMVSLALATIVAYASGAPNWSGMVRRAVVSAVVGLSVFIVVLQGIGAVSHSSPTLQALVDHQVNGLLHPADEKHSTAQLHTDMAIEGVRRGIHNPFGRGVGVITLAAEKFGTGTVNWEVDISNAFFSLGMLGGLTYLWILAHVLRTAWGLYRRTRDPLLLIISAMLLNTIPQWWNGGHYVLTPLLWMLIGFVNTAAYATEHSQEVGSV